MYHFFVQTWSRGKHPAKNISLEIRTPFKKILATLLEILSVGLVFSIQLGPGITKNLATPLGIKLDTDTDRKTPP